MTNGIFHKVCYSLVRMVYYIYWGVKDYNFQKNVVLSLKIHFVLANSADPDEMPHSAAFHLGLHCLPKYPVYKGLNNKMGQLMKFCYWLYICAKLHFYSFFDSGNFCCLLIRDNLCKQFGPRSGPTTCRSWSGSKPFDILIELLKEFCWNC